MVAYKYLSPNTFGVNINKNNFTTNSGVVKALKDF